MFKTILYIIEGYCKLFYYYITGRFHALYNRRLQICEKCEHNRFGMCDKCGCIIKAKVKVDYMVDDEGITLDGCPERKW